MADFGRLNRDARTKPRVWGRVAKLRMKISLEGSKISPASRGLGAGFVSNVPLLPRPQHEHAGPAAYKDTTELASV
jgi:hypothetical protein